MSKANQIYKSDEELIDFIFDNHPFGLPMFKKPRTNDRRLPIKYLKLGGPCLVVDNMPVLVARELNFHMCEEEQLIIGLRIIFAQTDIGRPENHSLFYEVATKDNVYMVEGATDCSGHGGSCKEHLDAMFILLSEMWNVEIEIIEIPYHRAEKIQRAIRMAIYNYHEQKKSWEN